MRCPPREPRGELSPDVSSRALETSPARREAASHEGSWTENEEPCHSWALTAYLVQDWASVSPTNGSGEWCYQPYKTLRQQRLREVKDVAQSHTA